MLKGTGLKVTADDKATWHANRRTRALVTALPNALVLERNSGKADFGSDTQNYIEVGVVSRCRNTRIMTIVKVI